MINLAFQSPAVANSE